MKVILAAVTSLNGNITKNNDPDIHSWTSKEDQDFFSKLVGENNLIVMGSKTYESIQDSVQLTPGKLRLVMTRSPEKYQSKTISEQLEFTDKNPEEIITEFDSKGYSQMLVAGGSEINTLFLKAGLVTDMYVTIEPVIFGKGTPVFAIDEFNVKLKLIETEKLNNQGTLLLHYSVHVS